MKKVNTLYCIMKKVNTLYNENVNTLYNEKGKHTILNYEIGKHTILCRAGNLLNDFLSESLVFCKKNEQMSDSLIRSFLMSDLSD